MGISKKKKPALALTKGAPGGRLMKRFFEWLRLLAWLQLQFDLAVDPPALWEEQRKRIGCEEQ